jgi:hypothetical protein
MLSQGHADSSVRNSHKGHPGPDRVPNIHKNKNNNKKEQQLKYAAGHELSLKAMLTACRATMTNML